MRDTLRAARTVFAVALRASPVRAVAVVVLTIGSFVVGVITPVFLEHITDGAVRGDTGRVVAAAAALAASSLLLMWSSWFGFLMRRRLEELTGLELSTRMIRLAASITTVEHHERAEYHDKLELLRVDREQLAVALGVVVTAVGSVIQLVVTAGILASVHPLLVLLPAFAAPSLVAAGYQQTKVERARDRSAEAIRVSDHLYSVVTNPAAAKELRVFGLGTELRRRYRLQWRTYTGAMTRAIRDGGVAVVLGWACFGAGYVGGVVFAVGLVVRGQVTVGAVVLTVTLAASLNQTFAQAAGTVSYVAQSLAVVRRYLWLEDHARSVRERERPVGGTRRVPDTLQHGIRFESVTFTYPGTDAAVLTDVSFTIPAGATIAVVGDNGAGKSTIVKLLCRFYEPTSGLITVDGVALSDLDPVEWRGRISGAFQDFVRFHLVAGEVVGIGDLDHLGDDGLVARALDRASAADVIAALPDGLATQLGRSFADGHELSGGQWQKLALGRAMVRRDPLLLVLDEPTASLDPETEAALFERYAAAARASAARTGAITVLVSHRFSTVRMADLVVVVDDGRIRELGNHADLVRANGLYAELYELQARAYR